jgi:hypothetical protein
MVLHNGV